VKSAIGFAVRSEFDLAAELDDRPVVAITGTDGKTTVTTMVTDMLSASGVRAAAVGNTETPLVTAIADDDLEVFVVEASSFRLGHTHRFVPAVATWLNFGNKGDYVIAVEGDQRLFNQYGIILVNPAKHAHVKKDDGQAFIDWVISAEGQAAIGAYQINGAPAFFPNAGT